MNGVYKLSVLGIVLMFLSCCGPQDNTPVSPSADLQELVSREVHSFLDLRLESNDWVVMSAVDAGWRSASDMAMLVAWFEQAFHDPDWWDVGGLFDRLRATDLYRGSGVDPPDSTRHSGLTSLVLEAMDTYTPPPEVLRQ